jgi:hypothetical protein
MSSNTWNTRLDKLTYSFSQDFGSLSASQLNWKPNAGTWSIAQNIQHLMLVNESYIPVLDQARRPDYRIPFLGRIGWVVKFFGQAILRAVEPARQKRMKTMALWQPSQSALPSDIVERFAQHQRELQNRINAADDLIRRGTIIASPANSNIVYRLETAFEIMVTHEERHLAQAREVLALLPGPRSVAG